MKILIFLLFNFSIYSQTLNLNGYWELIDYKDGKAQYKVTYGRIGGSYMGVLFSDSTVQFLDNIYFSDILSDKNIRSKEYKNRYYDNIYNKRNFKIVNNKLYLSLYGNNEQTELSIKVKADTLFLKNEEFDYEEIFLHKDYSSNNQVKFSKIQFSTSYCLGDCPVFKLEIDSSGKLSFEGIDHLVYLGRYEYQLQDTLLNELKNLVNIIYWSELDVHYFGIMHGPTMTTKIFCNDTLYKEISDNTGPVKSELKWLYNYFKIISILPFKKKIFEENILGDKNLKFRKISKNNIFNKHHFLDNNDIDFIMGNMLKTEPSSGSFIAKYFLVAYELVWNEKKRELEEIDLGIIETDGINFKLNSKVFKNKSYDLSEYFDAILEDN